MRRAAVSVSANVAEGCGRQGDVELRRFVRISLGALAELECEVLLSGDLTFVDAESCRRICGKIRRVRRCFRDYTSHSLKTPLDPGVGIDILC